MVRRSNILTAFVGAVLLAASVVALYAQEPAVFERGLNVIRGELLMGGVAGNTIAFEGATGDANETRFVVTDPTADRTVTFGDQSGTVVLGASGLKIAAGTITLDGTNPSSATTGLAAITACTVTDKRNDTLGDDPSQFTVFTSAVAGRLDVYAWKNTGGTDPTLVASTDADDLIDYVCVGT